MTDLPLRLVSETTSTITLGWDPVPGAVGYRFQSAANQPRWSHTWDPARTSVKFAKRHEPYRVQALAVAAAGVWPAAPPPPGPSWQGVLDQMVRPAFTPARTRTVTTDLQWNQAINDLQPGDLVDCRGLTLTGQQRNIANRQLADWAEIRFDAACRIIGAPEGTRLGAVWIVNSSRIRLYGGDLTAPGGTCLRIEDSRDITWWGLHMHDGYQGGLFVTSINRDNERLDIQATINRGATNPTNDPHSEKGTGIHAAYVGATHLNQTVRVRDSVFRLDVTDQPYGAAVQAGANIDDSALYVRAARCTFQAQSQVAGNALQLWGAPHRLRIPYLEATDLAGRAVETDGLYSTATNIQVEYGRATRTNQNPRLDSNPYAPHPAVNYQDCQ